MSQQEIPEPWSPLALCELEQGQRAVTALAKSHAMRRLVGKLERYIDGQLSGHSVLVAGHRGAGKTTMVLASMQQLYNRFAFGEDERVRPLLVRLHGPSLLAPDRETTQRSEAGEIDDPAQLHSKRFLQEMAAGIFPALLDELRRLLDRHIAPADGSEPDPGAQEMIAHLIDELSRGLGLAELRELFRRLGVLPGGLLGAEDAFEELTAIIAAGEAYLIVTGQLEVKIGDSRGQELLRSEERGARLSSEALIKGLTPAAAAVAAAFGIAFDHVSAGLLAALGVVFGGVTLNSTQHSKLARNADRVRTFKRDNTLESLVRRVPLLVDQLRAVGFPPIFVVDELDKISEPPLPQLLDGLLRNLKSYVTERSLILFLVDHDYYRWINQRIDSEGPGDADARPGRHRYSREHTFFSDSIYVVSLPADLHTYLDERLGPVGGADDEQTMRLCLDRGFVRHLLLHRARMHLYDLRREIVRAEEAGELAPNHRGPIGRPRAAKYEVFCQLCVEWLFARGVYRREIAEDPHFAQLLYDALYDVTHAWKRGAEMPAAVGDEASLRQLPLLERARDSLLGYLRDPGRLLQNVTDELDEKRLEHYLDEGHAEIDPGRARAALAELGRDNYYGRDEAVLGRVFASERFRLIQDLDRLALPPMLDEGRGWVIDSQGYGGADARLSDGDRERIEALAELRGFVRVDAIGFERLWNAATRNRDLGQLDGALERLEHLGADDEDNRRAAEDIVRSFATELSDVWRGILVLLVGLAVLEALGSEDRRANLDALASVTSPSPGVRAIASARAVAQLAEFGGVVLSDEARALLDEADGGPRLGAEFSSHDLDALLRVEVRDDTSEVRRAATPGWLAHRAIQTLPALSRLAAASGRADLLPRSR